MRPLGGVPVQVPYSLAPEQRIDSLRARLSEMAAERDLFRLQWHQARAVLQELVNGYTPDGEVPDCWKAAIALFKS